MKLLLIVFSSTLAGCLANVENEMSHRKDAAVLTNRVPSNEKGIIHNAICVGCEDLVSEIKSTLSNPEFIANLKTTLKKVCPYFGGAEQDCDNLVDDDLMSLIHQIQPFFENSTKTCTQIRFCSSEDAVEAKKFLLKHGRRFLSKVRSGSNSILCEECEFVVTEFKTLLDDKEQQAKIKEWLVGQCSNLGSLQDECKELISQNFDKVIGLLDSMLSNPKEVCAQIGVCSSRLSLWQKWSSIQLRAKSKVKEQFHTSKSPHFNAAMAKFYSSRKGVFSGGCIACKFSFEFVENFLVNNNASLMGIVEEVQKEICDRLPQDVNLQCRDFLSIYGKAALIMTIKNFLQPETICRDIQACSPDQILLINQASLNTVQGAAVCEACEAALGILKMELNRKDVQEEMNKGLMALICDRINPEYKPQCNQVIEGYMGQVWQILDDALNPDNACKTIKAC